MEITIRVVHYVLLFHVNYDVYFMHICTKLFIAMHYFVGLRYLCGNCLVIIVCST